MSDDGGRSWGTAGFGLSPEATVTDMAFDPTSPNIVYVSDISAGVSISGDGGTTWRPTNDGLMVRAVNALALTDDGAHLYAATEGRGVFRLEL